MKLRHIALLLFPLLVALCSAWGPKIIKAPCPAWSSSSIPTDSLIIWHKPETLSGTNGQQVWFWADSSGAQCNAVTNAGTVGGTRLTNSIVDGFSALFTPSPGTTGLIYTNNSILRKVDGATMFFVWKFVSSSTRYFFQFSQGDEANVPRLSMGGNFGSLEMDGSSLDSDAYAAVDLSSLALGNNSWLFWTLEVDYKNHIGKVYTNGILKVTDNAFTSGNTTSDTDSQLCKLFGTSSSGANVAFMEILLYKKVLDATSRTQVFMYFSNKYPSLNVHY